MAVQWFFYWKKFDQTFLNQFFQFGKKVKLSSIVFFPLSTTRRVSVVGLWTERFGPGVFWVTAEQVGLKQWKAKIASKQTTKKLLSSQRKFLTTASNNLSHFGVAVPRTHWNTAILFADVSSALQTARQRVGNGIRHHRTTSKLRSCGTSGCTLLESGSAVSQIVTECMYFRFFDILPVSQIVSLQDFQMVQFWNDPSFLTTPLFFFFSVF